VILFRPRQRWTPTRPPEGEKEIYLLRLFWGECIASKQSVILLHPSGDRVQLDRLRRKEQFSKGFALTWYRALTWYSSPARPFAAPDVPLLVTGQQGSPSPTCRQLSRAPNACAESSREESTKLGHGTKLGRTFCYVRSGESLEVRNGRP